MSSFVPPSALGFLLLSFLSWGESYFYLRGYRAIWIIENTLSFSMVLEQPLCLHSDDCLLKRDNVSTSLLPLCLVHIALYSFLWSSLLVPPPFFSLYFWCSFFFFFFLYLYLCMLFSLHFKSMSHRALKGLELRQRRCLKWDGSHIS